MQTPHSNTSQAPPPDGENSNVTEKDLAAQLQVARKVLATLRKTILKKEADWIEIPGRGILLTPTGVEKIKKEVPPPTGQTTARPAPETLTLRIRMLAPNSGVVFGEPVNGQRVVIKLTRGGSPFYVRGMELPGCYKLPQAELWAYDGPKPKATGRF